MVVHVLVKSPKNDYDISKRILERIENGEEAAISSAIIQEVVDWLEYNNQKKEVRSFLTAINSYFSLQKLNNTWNDYLPALDNVDKYGIDFVDALTLQQMKKNKINEIYSNDKDFDRIKWTTRIWE